MNIAVETAELKNLAFLASVDMHSLMYPKSFGMEALESRLMGGTCIATEGLVERIKERASKIGAKIATFFDRAMKFISVNKYWVAGTLSIVAAFSVAAVAIFKKADPEKKARGEARSYLKEIEKLRKQAASAIRKKKADFNHETNERAIKEKQDRARESIRLKQDIQRKRARDAKYNTEYKNIGKQGVESSSKANAELGKISSALKVLREFGSKGSQVVTGFLKAKKEEEKKGTPASEAFNFRNMSTSSIFIPFAGIAVAIGAVASLLFLCKAPKSEVTEMAEV